jgi:CBS domain-containing protein
VVTIHHWSRRRNAHLYQLGLLFIPFRLYGYDSEDNITKSIASPIPRNARLVTGKVKLIDRESKKVETDAGSYRYDWLISTMGCRIAPEEIEGMQESMGNSVHTFYDLGGAIRLQKALDGMQAGRLVIDICAVPPNLGPEVLDDSELGDGTGYGRTDPRTLKSRKADFVYFLGDNSNVSTSKAGSVAHFEAETVVENVLREMEDKLIGILTEADFLSALDIHGGSAIQDLFETIIRRRRTRNKMGTIVDDIMTKHPVRISAEDTLQRTLELMNKNRIKRLVITDEDDRVQGVISRADLIKLYTMR